MNLKLKRCLNVACGGLVLVSAVAFAHGDEHAKDGPVVKEQKPWGIAADRKPGLRTIRMSMNDAMRFNPATVQVTEGETVRLLVKNEGKLMHELVLGTRAQLEEHAALMKKYPNMEHAEPYMAHVAPGKVGEIVWTFNRPGDFEFACLMAGHFEAGMQGKIKVAARTRAAENKLNQPQ